MLWTGLLCVGLGFVLGAVPFGVIVARARGVDLRAVGSGNIGATNVARAIGKKLGLLVLLLDVLKGFAPALLARLLMPAADPRAAWWLGATMLAAVAGHVFTPVLRFHGGKGVATGLGVVLAACPLAGLGGAAVFAALYARYRLASLGSLFGAAAVPLIMLLLGEPMPIWLAGVAIWLIIIATHHANIRRLLRGEEPKV